MAGSTLYKRALLAAGCLGVMVPAGALAQAPSWSAAAPLSTPATTTGEPSSVVDAAGNATVAWTQIDAAGRFIQTTTRSAASGAWTAPTAISSPAIPNQTRPRLGVDAAGNVTAVWSGNGQVHVAAKPAGGVWSAPAVLAQGSDSDVAVDAAGNARAVWISNGNVRTSVRPAGGAWSASVSLSSGDVTSPRIASNASGVMAVTWLRRASGEQFRTRVRVIDAAGNISGTTTAGSATAPAVSPRVAVSATGAVAVAWNTQQNAQTYRVHAVVRPSTGGTFGSSSTLLTDGVRGTSPTVTLVATEAGFVAAWTRQTATDRVIQARVRTDTWGTAVNLSRNGGQSRTPALAADTSGNVTVAWEDRQGTGAGVYTATLSGGTWSVANKVADVASPRNPTIAMAAPGNAILAWRSLTSPTETIDAAVSTTVVPTPPAPVCPTRPQFNSIIYKDGVTSFYYRPRVGQTILGARRLGTARLRVLLQTAKGRATLPRLEYTTARPVDARRLPWFARKVGTYRVVTAIMSDASSTAYSGVRLAYQPRRGTYAKLILPNGTVRTLRADCPKITGYKTIYAQNIFVNRTSTQ